MQTDLYAESLLTKGEKILMTCDVHWGIYWKSAALGVIALLVGLFIAEELGFILLAAAVIGGIHSFIMTRMLLLVLTNKRVLMRYGILQVDVVSMSFKNIESVELERMLPGFLLGYSNVIVMGIGQRYVVIPYISNGVTFRRAFNELILDNVEEYEEEIIEEDEEVPSGDDKSKKVKKKIRTKRTRKEE
ncbi:MAG: PH domain-containing protein [Alphaproteobacteria bacterium]